MASSGSFDSKSLPSGTIIEGGKHPYRILDTISADSQGFTYHACFPAEGKAGKEAGAGKDVVVREHFMSLCSDRGADGKSVETPEDIISTVNDCLHGFEQASELRMQIASRHPSVINVIDSFKSNGTVYYVVEFLNGETLEEYVLKKGKLDIEEAIDLLTPVIHAVERFHAARSLHADITPRHMRFTTENGKRVLVLFNLYNTIHFNEDGSKIWYVQPSACDDGYAAPEQYGEIEHFTPQTDVYSLAATLAFMITGEHVPDSRHFDEDAIREFLPPTLPETYASALIHAMEQETTQRTQSTTDFLTELGRRTPVRPSDDRNADEAQPDKREKHSAVGSKMLWMGVLTAIAIGVAIWISKNLF